MTNVAGNGDDFGSDLVGTDNNALINSLYSVSQMAKDSEGNGFESIHCTPSKGCFNQSENDFVDVENYEELDENDTNAVCIN
jgi:hypothetical protein